MSDPRSREDVLFCWSGGKDSAMALHAMSAAGGRRAAALLTTITDEYDRISMAVLFGGMALAERRFPSLRDPLSAMAGQN